jgi:hypothetical protein
MPVYYLYCHALELTMKAFLRTRGFSAKCLRSPEFGHKLQVLWEACVAQGLHSSVAKDAVIADVIGLLNPYATEFEFRYLKVGYKKLPGLGWGGEGRRRPDGCCQAALSPHLSRRALLSSGDFPLLRPCGLLWSGQPPFPCRFHSTR